MHWFLLAVLLSVLQFLTLSQAQIAALEVRAFGDEVYDLATGDTTLPDGGAIIEREQNIRLEAPFIRYQEGRFVEAREATVAGEFGQLYAEIIYLDLEAQVLRAEGHVELVSDQLATNTEGLLLYLEPLIAVATGNVNADSPSFESAAVVLATREQLAYLLAPYAYEDGPLTISSNDAEDMLQLSWQTLAEGGEVSFKVSSQVDEAKLEPFLPYMPQSEMLQ